MRHGLELKAYEPRGGIMRAIVVDHGSFERVRQALTLVALQGRLKHMPPDDPARISVEAIVNAWPRVI